MRAHGALVVMLALVVSMAACGPSQGGQTHLGEAAAMMPGGVGQVWFTDWALLRSYAGAEDLSSRSSLEERRELGTFLARKGLSREGCAGGDIEKYPDLWGWDITDLVWEAESSACVLKFRDSFDLAPVVAHYEERGFSVSEYRGVKIYSHEMGFKEQWQRDSPHTVLNTAVLGEERVLILSSEVDGVHAVLDAYKGGRGAFGDARAIQATVDRLGEVAGAVVLPAAWVCPSVSVRKYVGQAVPLPRGISDRMKDELTGVQVHTYSALGLGYRYEEDNLVELVVMHYDRAEDAQADLEVRRRLVEEGPMLGSRTLLYSDLFTLDRSYVEGSDLVFQLHPNNDMPRGLFSLVVNYDLVFAVCP